MQDSVKRHVELVTSPIKTGVILDMLDAESSGAVTLFLGRTRGLTRERRTLALEYDCYDSMALKEMNKLIDRASESFRIDGIVIVHRLGLVPVGQTSVAIAVASPHRDAAYACSRFLIDTLKEMVPIWKKETYADGQSEWVEGAGRGGSSGERDAGD